MQIPAAFMLAQFFYAGGHPDLGALKQAQIISASDYATHIAGSVATTSIVCRVAG